MNKYNQNPSRTKKNPYSKSLDPTVRIILNGFGGLPSMGQCPYAFRDIYHMVGDTLSIGGEFQILCTD